MFERPRRGFENTEYIVPSRASSEVRIVGTLMCLASQLDPSGWQDMTVLLPVEPEHYGDSSDD
jgi:hypothetical protein